MRASRRFDPSFVLARAPLALLLAYTTACEHASPATESARQDAAVLAADADDMADAATVVDMADAANTSADTPSAAEGDGGAQIPAPSDLASVRGPQSSAAELALLSRARRMVRKSPARALSITIDHQRRFKQSQHAELREVVAIEALVRLARPTEARARARAFFLAYPQAREGDRVRMLLDHNGD